ncbi:hypothetical protein KDA23_05975 [Candidatus Saccharibacteria bacterium]|nr:hypothetical protein [Candidatus Saccharibacteria bacterium]
MAHARQKSKTAKIQTSNLYTFVATLSGVVVGVVASLAMVGPMVRSEIAAATRDLQARPVSSLSECYSPNDVGGASSTAKPKAPAPMPSGGSGGGGSSSSNEVVEKIVYSNTTVASMHNTGPGSTNQITTVNRNSTEITNNNNVSVINENNQQASSSSATVSGNTNGGNADSGDASNKNETSTGISISN